MLVSPSSPQRMTSVASSSQVHTLTKSDRRLLPTYTYSATHKTDSQVVAIERNLRLSNPLLTRKIGEIQ